MSKRILITAGASGIGLATARAFVAQGDKVHIADINAEAVAEVVASDDHITGTVADVSKPEDIARIFADIDDALGGLDTLINNAGIAGPTAPTEDTDPDAFDAVLDVNLRGTFRVTQHAIPRLKANEEGGAIVTMSSMGGKFGYPNRIAYSTTKFGLVGFAQTLARELGEFGITSNSVLPGAINGPRLQGVLQGRADLAGTTLEEENAKALANQSVQSFTEPEEVAALILFLTGPNGRHISGQAISIDGDSYKAS
ncbi:SDR family oxidoreductase [Corynebacterium sp. S7]